MTTRILIPLHRARNLQPGDEYVQDGQLYGISKVDSRFNKLHRIVLMARVPRSDHYSNRNWSSLFRCPICGKEKRQNTNFLGRRKMDCNGVISGPSLAFVTPLHVKATVTPLPAPKLTLPGKPI